MTNTLLHNNKLLHNRLHSLCHNFCPGNKIYLKMKTGVLEEMKGETLPITSSRDLWILFNMQMAFHNRKSNIYKFSFSHLLLNFEINVKQYFADISILANDICQGAQLIRCHKASLHSESYTCNSHSF